MFLKKFFIDDLNTLKISSFFLFNLKFFFLSFFYFKLKLYKLFLFCNSKYFCNNSKIFSFSFFYLFFFKKKLNKKIFKFIFKLQTYIFYFFVFFFSKQTNLLFFFNFIYFFKIERFMFQNYLNIRLEKTFFVKKQFFVKQKFLQFFLKKIEKTLFVKFNYFFLFNNLPFYFFSWNINLYFSIHNFFLFFKLSFNIFALKPFFISKFYKNLFYKFNFFNFFSFKFAFQKLSKIFFFVKQQVFLNEDKLYTDILVRSVSSIYGSKTIIILNKDLKIMFSYSEWILIEFYYIRLVSFSVVLHPFFDTKVLQNLNYLVNYAFLDENTNFNWYEIVLICFLTFKSKDAIYLLSFCKQKMESMNLFMHKHFLDKLFEAFDQLFSGLTKLYNIFGIKLITRGKISVTGNARTRTLIYQCGLTSSSNINLKVDHNFVLINTNTGCLGLSVWIYY